MGNKKATGIRMAAGGPKELVTDVDKLIEKFKEHNRIFIDSIPTPKPEMENKLRDEILENKSFKIYVRFMNSPEGINKDRVTTHYFLVKDFTTEYNIVDSLSKWHPEVSIIDEIGDLVREKKFTELKNVFKIRKKCKGLSAILDKENPLVTERRAFPDFIICNPRNGFPGNTHIQPNKSVFVVEI